MLHYIDITITIFWYVDGISGRPHVGHLLDFYKYFHFPSYITTSPKIRNAQKIQNISS